MARPLSSELIAEVVPRGRTPQATSVEEIQQLVAERFGISRAELVGSSRAATPLRARQVAIYLTRDLTQLSLPEIGRLYGGRDHSTVLNSLRRVEASIDEDAELSPAGPGVARQLSTAPARAEPPDPMSLQESRLSPQALPQARSALPGRIRWAYSSFPQVLSQLKKAITT